jgi:diketogulonate reductase-like aldo/keto reductase
VHHLNELEAYMKEVGGTLDVGQWELHPWLQRDDIVSWCYERGVVVEAYCPLVRAQRSGEEVLKKLADKYGKTWAQVLVRWSLQKVSSCFIVWVSGKMKCFTDFSTGFCAVTKEYHAGPD